ncbi:MAG: hypothetical protein F6K41_13795 [Symploca sp. SIO3E6]|nr:hypothetical protein [Caldora sp. SIO3E6]
MNTVSINPGRLFKDSLGNVSPIYGSLLLLNSPDIIFVLLINFLPYPINSILSIIYYLILPPLILGATIIYIYRYLNQNHISVADAFEYAASKYLRLLFGLILLVIILIPAFILLIIPAFILLIIPGIYLSIRLGFISCAIVIEDCSVIEVIKLSWELTAGRWWSIFWASLAVSLALVIPVFLISFLVIANLGVETGSVLSPVVSGTFSYLVSPVLGVYYVLLYTGLQRSNRAH